MSAKTYTVQDIFWIVVRRRWLILVPFAIGLAAIPLIARLVPQRFRSETLIMVVPQRVPDSYVKSTITETVKDRLPSITDQILSRSRLEQIIADLDLYKQQRTLQIMEDVVRRMRDDINVTLDEKSMDSFRVTYVSDDPATARKVTERLASLYIEQNMRDRESQAEGTSEFLGTQLNEAKRRLVEHEKKLEEYRRLHAGELPTQLQGNLQAMQSAQLQLQAISESMNRARERRLLMERQIADAQAFAPPAAQPAVASPSSDVPVQGQTTEQQLEAAEARLEAYKLRYTRDHPDVLSLQQTIADLQKRLETERPVGIGISQAVSEKKPSPLEVAQEKRIREVQAELDVIDHHLDADQAEETRLKQTIAAYQARVDVLPTRESELVELTRDYSTLQTAYTNLLTKREDSKIAANLERRQIGQRFTVLDQASLPQRPDNRSRRMAIMASGAVGGLVFGLLVVGFLEYRESGFRREEDVRRVLALPVLALVPLMASDRERRTLRRRALAADVAGIAVMLGAAVILVLWRLRA